MRNALHEFFRPTKEEFEKLWVDARITFDASSLLNLYGYSAETKKELIAAYETFKERIILPYQFALEYSRNRAKIISKQISNFRSAEDDLEKLRNKHTAKHEQPHLSKKSLDAIGTILKELAEGKAKLERSMASDEDSDLLLKLFGGKVSAAPTTDDLKAFHLEGKARYDLKTPPGFVDIKDKGEPDCYGDFIAWKQIMAIAAAEKRDFILVTDDAKEDWWHYEGSRLVGPLPALRKEFREVNGQSIWLYNTEGFLRAAKEYSQVKVGDDALGEVKAAFDRKRRWVNFELTPLSEAKGIFVFDKPSLGEFKSTWKSVVDTSIFAEEAKRMADEVVDEARREEQRKAELRLVALKIGEDLISYMASYPSPHDIDISVDENVVKLRKKATDDTMDIKCSGRDSFEIYLGGQLATGTNQSQMVRGVIDWLKR
jgi:hypothetical protein